MSIEFKREFHYEPFRIFQNGMVIGEIFRQVNRVPVNPCKTCGHPAGEKEVTRAFAVSINGRLWGSDGELVRIGRGGYSNRSFRRLKDAKAKVRELFE